MNGSDALSLWHAYLARDFTGGDARATFPTLPTTFRVSSSSSIEIRLAESNDAPAIAALLAAAFAEYLPLYTPEGYAATAIKPDEIVSRIEEGPVWVSISGGLIVGTISVVLKGESLYLRGMAVLPLASGQRIGQVLLAHVEEFAMSKGVQRLFLSTTPFLDRAIRLYEHLGFRRTSAGPHELFGTPLFTMEKFIQRSQAD
jgi:GNAT superfamily N-acetyltransferase